MATRTAPTVATCPDCGLPRVPYCRGLCELCYKKARRATATPKPRPKTPCRHCQVKTANRPRGLCFTCYYAPGVLAFYPATSKFAGKREPTEAELEATIAEQSKCLPPWWESESRKVAAEGGAA